MASTTWQATDDLDQGVNWPSVLAEWTTGLAAPSTRPPSYQLSINDPVNEKGLPIRPKDEGDGFEYLQGWRLRLMSLRYVDLSHQP